MKYTAQIVTQLKIERKENLIIFEVDLEYKEFKEKEILFCSFEILELRIVKAPVELYLLNPLNNVGKIVFEINENKKIKRIKNFGEIKERVKIYYKKLKEEITSSLEEKEIIQQFSYGIFDTEEKTLKELLSVMYLYAFLGGNYNVDFQEKTNIDGYTKDYRIPIKYTKKTENNITKINGEVDSENISFFVLEHEMKDLGIEYDEKKLYFKWEEEIVYNIDENIENVRMFREGGIKTKIEKKEIMIINRIGE